jgi:NAD(P)-dependent dehydrogenase (short-subunit alcohol dehydrogenase family)
MVAILQELGKVDVLVLSAASVHRRAKATEFSTQEIRDTFDTNVTAAFDLTKAYLATPLPASCHKTVINVSSAVVQVSRTLRRSQKAWSQQTWGMDGAEEK